LLNPFRWRKSGKDTSARSIYDQWIKYVGEPHTAMRKLGEISRMKASDRPHVYFYVPKKWHESLLSNKD